MYRMCQKSGTRGTLSKQTCFHRKRQNIICSATKGFRIRMICTHMFRFGSLYSFSMPYHLCIFCGRTLRRELKGRPANVEQLQQAALYHHPHTVTDTYICDKCRKGSLTTAAHKHERRPSSNSSHSSDLSSKRQRTAEILSSLSQSQQQQTATVPHKLDTTTSALPEPEPESSTSSARSVVTTATSMSVPQHHTSPERLRIPSDVIRPHGNDHKYPVLDNQELKRNGLPYNTWFEVRKSTVCSGWGLFTRPGITIEAYMHIAFYCSRMMTYQSDTRMRNHVM